MSESTDAASKSSGKNVHVIPPLFLKTGGASASI